MRLHVALSSVQDEFRVACGVAWEVPPRRTCYVPYEVVASVGVVAVVLPRTGVVSVLAWPVDVMRLCVSVVLCPWVCLLINAFSQPYYLWCQRLCARVFASVFCLHVATTSPAVVALLWWPIGICTRWSIHCGIWACRFWWLQQLPWIAFRTSPGPGIIGSWVRPLAAGWVWWHGLLASATPMRWVLVARATFLFWSVLLVMP